MALRIPKCKYVNSCLLTYVLAWRWRCSDKTEFGKPKVSLGACKEGAISLQVVAVQFFMFELVIYKKSAGVLPVAPEPSEGFN